MTELAIVPNPRYNAGRRVNAWCALACTLMTGSAELAAQGYPSRPVRMVVPLTPGGGGDIIGRALAQRLTDVLGQQVVVENRPGATGNIGMEFVARAAPDGYTLLLIGPNLTTNVSLFSKVSYDPIKDFAPISLLTSTWFILDAHPSLPVRSVKELIALARARPGQVDYGSGGNGSADHLGMELFRHMAKINMVHVPYKGGAAMLTDLLGGRISIGYNSMITAVPFIRAGQLRALAVSGARRTPLLPELPTMAESGFPGYDLTVWQGFLAPAGTPENIVARLHEATITAMQRPDTRERMVALGVEITTSTRQEFAAFIKSEIDKWGAIIRASGAKVD